MDAHQCGRQRTLAHESGASASERTYRPETPVRGEDPQEQLRAQYERGDLKIFLRGERLKGGFVLVRMKRPGRPQWLLIKHRDELAERGSDIVKGEKTSVKTGRTLKQIAEGKRGQARARAGSASAAGRRQKASARRGNRSPT